MLWQRAMQVPLNFIGSQSARAKRLFDQLRVIPGVSGHVVDSTYRGRRPAKWEKQLLQRSHMLGEHIDESQILRM